MTAVATEAMKAMEGSYVARERTEKVKTLPLKALFPYRQYNRNRLEDWLGSWCSTSKGTPKAHPDELINKTDFGPQGPGSMSMARLVSLVSEDIIITDRILGEVVDELRRFRPRAYRNLIPVYFDDYASEGAFEEWRKSDSPDEQARAVGVEVSIKWMLREAERKLADRGRKRLVVLAPWASTKNAEDLVANERERKERENRRRSGRPDADEAERQKHLTLDLYYKKLDDAEEQAEMYGRSRRWAVGEAMRSTVEKTGYSEQWIRKLRSDLEK